jgi:hypothetical protein
MTAKMNVNFAFVFDPIIIAYEKVFKGVLVFDKKVFNEGTIGTELGTECINAQFVQHPVACFAICCVADCLSAISHDIPIVYRFVERIVEIMGLTW